MPILRVASALDKSANARSTRMIKHPYELHTRIYPILGFRESFWGAKFSKMGHSLPGMPMNHCTKFDAATFILGGEIRNRTDKQTKLQTVSDISTSCLSACVDNSQRV